MKENKAVKGFCCGNPLTKTFIEILEVEDGDIVISFSTKREGKDDLVTSLSLNPQTFRLLSDSMSMVHNPNVWKDIKEK